jgi:hypothetical protein
MRYASIIFGFSAIAILVAMQPTNANDGKKQIKATQTWSGKIGDDNPAKLTPKVGYLTNQKAFEELWKGWNLKDKAPMIDFTKDLVFVHVSLGGPNIPKASYTLDAKGDLKSLAIATLIAGPGFGYSIDVLPRDGIKSYMGKAIEEAKEKK